MTEDPLAALNDEDTDILEHALRLDECGVPYGRYYIAPLHSSEFDVCERLVSIGLMVKHGKPAGIGQIFLVTRLGAERIGAPFNEKWEC